MTQAPHPTPGKPLDQDSVKLLLPGDVLQHVEVKTFQRTFRKTSGEWPDLWLHFEEDRDSATLCDRFTFVSRPTPAPQEASGGGEGEAMAASDLSCYRYPGVGQQSERAAFVDGVLSQTSWSVHVRGPDEIVAAKSYRDAVDYCDRLNAECSDARAVPMPSAHPRAQPDRALSPSPATGTGWPSREVTSEEMFGVTGAADEAEALAVALFCHRCPGVRMTDEDLHYYRAAAVRALLAVKEELDFPDPSGTPTPTQGDTQ